MQDGQSRWKLSTVSKATEGDQFSRRAEIRKTQTKETQSRSAND